MQVTRSWTVLTAGSTGGLDVKIKGRTDDGSMRQLNDWLAELREDGPAEPPGGDRAEPPGDNGPAGRRSALPGPKPPPSLTTGQRSLTTGQRSLTTGQQSPNYGPAEPDYGPAEPDYRLTEPDYDPVEPQAGPAVRAVIGDELRIPVMWCEMGACISWHADPAALGEGDFARPRDRRGLAHRRLRPSGLPKVPAGRPELPGLPPSRRVGPWHRYDADSQDRRRARGARALAGGHPGTGNSGH